MDRCSKAGDELWSMETKGNSRGVTKGQELHPRLRRATSQQPAPKGSKSRRQKWPSSGVTEARGGSPAAAQLLPLLLLRQVCLPHVLADDGHVGLGNVVSAVLAEGKDLLLAPAQWQGGAGKRLVAGLGNGRGGSALHRHGCQRYPSLCSRRQCSGPGSRAFTKCFALRSLDKMQARDEVGCS